MYVGKTLFAQVMQFVSWTSLTRIVARYKGDAGIRTLSCAEQFRAMVLAQLTWRESLRDIQLSLRANPTQLYAMGFRSCVKRSTLADANESRDSRIWFDLATLLIRRARKLDCAPFRSTKAAIELHTLLDLRGCIRTFIDVSEGKLHDVNVLDMLTFEPGAFYVMDRRCVDFARLYLVHQAGAFFVTRAKSNFNAPRVYSSSNLPCVDSTYSLTRPCECCDHRRPE